MNIFNRKDCLIQHLEHVQNFLNRHVKNILSISKIFELVQNIFMKQMVRALVLINCGLAANLSCFCIFGQAQRTFNATLRTNFFFISHQSKYKFKKNPSFFSNNKNCNFHHRSFTVCIFMFYLYKEGEIRNHEIENSALKKDLKSK